MWDPSWYLHNTCRQNTKHKNLLSVIKSINCSGKKLSRDGTVSFMMRWGEALRPFSAGLMPVPAARCLWHRRPHTVWRLREIQVALPRWLSLTKTATIKLFRANKWILLKINYLVDKEFNSRKNCIVIRSVGREFWTFVRLNLLDFPSISTGSGGALL